MESIDLNNISILISKIGIVLIFIILFFMIIKRIFKKFSCVPESKSESTDSEICPPPNLQFFGRSRSETIAINAFARVLYDRGINWNQIKVGYKHEGFKNTLTGKLLILDAYAPLIKIAIEYNGIQHYKYPNPFNKTEKDFLEGLERDKLKRQLCKEHGITLIEIPYWIDTCIPDKKNIGEWKYRKNNTNEKWVCIKEFIEKSF